MITTHGLQSTGQAVLQSDVGGGGPHMGDPSSRRAEAKSGICEHLSCCSFVLVRQVKDKGGDV